MYAPLLWVIIFPNLHACNNMQLYQSYKKLEFTTHTNTNMWLHMDSKKPDTYINESGSPYSGLTFTSPFGQYALCLQAVSFPVSDEKSLKPSYN